MSEGKSETRNLISVWCKQIDVPLKKKLSFLIVLEDVCVILPKEDDCFCQSRWPSILRPFVCWDCVFESRVEHGCPSLVSVVCCQVEVFATG